MRKTIIFLDIDGVLVPFGKEHVQTRSFHPPCVAVLKEIIALFPNPRIVFSTTWRIAPYQQNLCEQFIEHGLPINKCIDGTPDLRYSTEYGNIYQLRGQEIAAWLEANPLITDWLVLDDDKHGILPLLPAGRCIFPSESRGLQPDHIEAAKYIKQSFKFPPL